MAMGPHPVEMEEPRAWGLGAPAPLDTRPHLETHTPQTTIFLQSQTDADHKAPPQCGTSGNKVIKIFDVSQSSRPDDSKFQLPGCRAPLPSWPVVERCYATPASLPQWFELFGFKRFRSHECSSKTDSELCAEPLHKAWEEWRAQRDLSASATSAPGSAETSHICSQMESFCARDVKQQLSPTCTTACVSAAERN